MQERVSNGLGITNILTVDVEDWPQSTLNPHLPISGRALSNTRRLLDLFQEFGAKATFFVQGRVAEKFPKLVERIADEGHEIGTHGHNHIPLFNQKPEEFEEDLRLSLEILGPMTLQPLLGYRAPDFSLRQDTLWALEILREQGIRYSSSIFPFRGRRYGVPGSLPGLHSTLEGITEVPLSVVPFAGRVWPVAGGGYLRLYPYRLTRWAMRRIQRRRSAGRGLYSPLRARPRRDRTVQTQDPAPPFLVAVGEPKENGIQAALLCFRNSNSFPSGRQSGYERGSPEILSSGRGRF